MRIAILSDIHEDYGSLQRVMEKAEARGFDTLVCLGDISGFSRPFYTYEKSRNAAACLALIREKCEVIIAGNHDFHASGTDPEIPESLRHRETWAHEEDLDPGYSKEDIAFLSTLPAYSVFPSESGNILFSHYAYPNLSGFVKGFYWKAEEFQEHFHFMQARDCSLCFTGHAHTRGFYRVRPSGFREYARRTITLTSAPSVIGIPPVTWNGLPSSFCIFDTESLRLQLFR